MYKQLIILLILVITLCSCSSMYPPISFPEDSSFHSETYGLDDSTASESNDKIIIPDAEFEQYELESCFYQFFPVGRFNFPSLSAVKAVFTERNAKNEIYALAESHVFGMTQMGTSTAIESVDEYVDFCQKVISEKLILHFPAIDDKLIDELYNVVIVAGQYDKMRYEYENTMLRSCTIQYLSEETTKLIKDKSIVEGLETIHLKVVYDPDNPNAIVEEVVLGEKNVQALINILNGGNLLNVRFFWDDMYVVLEMNIYDALKTDAPEELIRDFLSSISIAPLYLYD